MFDGTPSFLEMLKAGGFTLYVLLICSLATWGVIFERAGRPREVSRGLAAFHMEAMRKLMQSDREGLKALCRSRQDLPTAALIDVALGRLGSPDARLRDSWREAVERERQRSLLSLRGTLWVLGTVATAAPFIGLFGTVVGILQSFGDIARTGKGGFAVVASGISEALIATAAGIIVAVVAAIAFNLFQVRLSSLNLRVRHQADELLELVASPAPGDARHGA
ncbi:MAG: MotA/TolQ/ExbB proton channel family protein [Bdellovibrionales bacterium]|nr:MotA/TolQ/ExbB proton channel family protein [Bdellovibrionales bacterium]